VSAAPEVGEIVGDLEQQVLGGVLIRAGDGQVELGRL
jgi:hypothetical protein